MLCRLFSAWRGARVRFPGLIARRILLDYNLLVNTAARSGAGYLIATFWVTAITLAGRHWFHFNATTIALIFLLGVLGISAFYGIRPAVFVSVIATIAFNYFFLPPVGTFTISDPQNWIALFAFLVTAVAASELSARAKRGQSTAVERRLELERLYAFSQLLLSSDNAAELLNLIPRYIVESFGVRAAAISLTTRTDIYRSRPAIDGLESQDLQLVTLRGEPRIDSESQLAFMPLCVGVRVVGSMGVPALAFLVKRSKLSAASSQSLSSAPAPSKNSAAPKPHVKVSNSALFARFGHSRISHAPHRHQSIGNFTAWAIHSFAGGNTRTPHHHQRGATASIA